MRVTTALLVILLFSSAVKAEPKPWYKDPKVWALALTQAGSAAWQIKASHDCRQNAGIEKCFGGYGERKAMVGFVVGVNTGAFAMSLWWRHEDLSEWSIPGLSAASFNVSDAARNAHASCKTMIIAGQCQEENKQAGLNYQLSR